MSFSCCCAFWRQTSPQSCGWDTVPETASTPWSSPAAGGSVPSAGGRRRERDTGPGSVEDCSEHRLSHLLTEATGRSSSSEGETKGKVFQHSQLTRLVLDPGKQVDSLREAWNGLHHGVHESGTVLELRGRRLAMCWRLKHGRRNIFLGEKTTTMTSALKWSHPLGSHLSRTQCEIFLDDLHQEVRIQLFKVFHSQGQTLQVGEVRVHGIVQQVGHLLLRTPSLHGQHSTQVQQLLFGDRKCNSTPVEAASCAFRCISSATGEKTLSCYFYRQRYPRFSNRLLNLCQKFQLLFCIFKLTLHQLTTDFPWWGSKHFYKQTKKGKRSSVKSSVTVPVRAATLVSSKVMAILYHFRDSLVRPCSAIW